MDNVVKAAKTKKQRQFVERIVDQEQKEIELDDSEINTAGLDVSEDDDCDVEKIIYYAPKTRRSGKACVDALDALKPEDKCCECCKCVFAASGERYCVDCSVASHRKDIELILSLYSYDGELTDTEYQSLVNKFMEKWVVAEGGSFNVNMDLLDDD